jgi:elongation factor P
MSVKVSELRKGQVITYEGTMYTIKDMQHVAKGNWRSYYQVKLKDFKTGRIIEQRMAVDDRIDPVFVQTKPMEYLYRDGNDFVLADVETYDQVPVPADTIGEESIAYLKENTRVSCQLIDNQIVSVELPQVVELQIVDTPPIVKGATVTNQPKEAILETGAKVRVPGFIANGEVVRVDTRTGEYIERAK